LDDEQFTLLTERLEAAKRRLRELEDRPRQIREDYRDTQLAGDIEGAEQLEKELGQLLGNPVLAAQECAAILARLHESIRQARERAEVERFAEQERERMRGWADWSRPASPEELARREAEREEFERRSRFQHFMTTHGPDPTMGPV